VSETLDVEVVNVDGPGRQLAEAREAQGLSVEYVSGQLRLSLHILQALERDDYAQLPPAAFVSGYVRSYARLLGLPEQDLVDRYAAMQTPPPAQVGAVARSQPQQVQASDPPVRAFTYLVFGGLLVLSAVWWTSQRETVQEDTLSAPDAALAGAQEVPAAAETGAALPEPPTEAVPAAAESATADVPAPETVPAAATPAAPPVEAPAAQPAAAPAKPETPPPPPLTADVPQSKLVLDFTGECWTEITDAAGRQLVYDLAAAGRTISVRGEAPFTVFFGYSPAAQVTLNDEVFDHAPYQRRNDTARFRLGSAADNMARTD
jgi:cytoskeleton protein RodZ